VLRIQIWICKDPKLLPSRIRIRFRNKLIIRVRIWIRNYHWGSGLLKDKCYDKNTIFKIKVRIQHKKLPLNVNSVLKCKKFHKNFQDKDTDLDPDLKNPRAGSGSEMTLQVGSGSGSKINSFGSTTLRTLYTHEVLALHSNCSMDEFLGLGLALASISNRRRIEASIKRFFRYRIETNRRIPFSFGSKRMEKVYSKSFWRKKKRTLLF